MKQEDKTQQLILFTNYILNIEGLLSFFSLRPTKKEEIHLAEAAEVELFITGII